MCELIDNYDALPYWRAPDGSVLGSLVGFQPTDDWGSAMLLWKKATERFTITMSDSFMGFEVVVSDIDGDMSDLVMDGEGPLMLTLAIAKAFRLWDYSHSHDGGIEVV